MRRILFAALLLAFAVVAQAQTTVTDKPLFSKDRASLAAGLDYAFWSNPTGAPSTAFKKEWEASLYAAYVLTPRFTIASSAAYLTDSKLVRYRVGIRTVIWKGRE